MAHIKLQKMAMTGVFSAMIFVLTAFVHVPVASGYVHFGDALVYICAMVLGSPWALLAGALGEGLADIVGGFAIYAPATIIIKVLVALPFIWIARRSEKLLSLRSVLMTLPAGVITVGGYFIADLIISRAYAFADIIGNIIQAVGSAVLFAVVAAALDKLKLKDRITEKIHHG